MAYPRFGNYQAVVTDNSEFWKRGYIRVRISVFYSGSVNWDLSQPYNDAAFRKELKDDIRCLVYMPFGGGSGHGMFTLPQVNSLGIVSFLDGDTDKAMWMGSFVKPEYDDEGKFVSANVPNDSINKEGAGSDGVTKDGKNVDIEGGAFILRQKSTQPGSAEGMNWDKNRTENLVVLSDKKLSLTHATSWNEEDDNISPQQYQEISISKETNKASDNYGLVSINVKTFIANDEETFDEFGIEVVDKQVKIITKSVESKIENTVLVDSENIVMTSLDTNTKEATNATISPKEIYLANKDANITIDKDEVNVFGKNKVTLSGDKIYLGGVTNEHVVTASRAFSFRMEDGTVLTSSHRAWA